jgi:hypothetical protein
MNRIFGWDIKNRWATKEPDLQPIGPSHAQAGERREDGVGVFLPPIRPWSGLLKHETSNV